MQDKVFTEFSIVLLLILQKLMVKYTHHDLLLLCTTILMWDEALFVLPIICLVV